MRCFREFPAIASHHTTEWEGVPNSIPTLHVVVILPLEAVISMSKIPLKTSRPGPSWVSRRPWSSGPSWVPRGSLADPGHQESPLLPSSVAVSFLLAHTAILEMNSACELLLGRLISIAVMNLKLPWHTPGAPSGHVSYLHLH